jgi:hypothetical protein
MARSLKKSFISQKKHKNLKRKTWQIQGPAPEDYNASDSSID